MTPIRSRELLGVATGDANNNSNINNPLISRYKETSANYSLTLRRNHGE